MRREEEGGQRMKCPRCQAEFFDRSRFCPVCGYNVEDLVEEDLVEEYVVEDDVSEEFVDELESPEEAEPEAEPELDATYVDGAEETTEAVEIDDTAEAEETAEAAEVEDVPGAEVEDTLEPEPVETPKPTPAAPIPEPAPAAKPDVRTEARPTERRESPARPTRTRTTDSPDMSDDYSRASAYERGGIRALIRRWRTVLIAVVCVLALILAGVSSVRWNKGQKEADEAAAAADAREADIRTPVEIGVGIDLAGYDEAHMTPVPFRVAGSAATGEAVDEFVTIQHPNVDTLSLLKGTYIVSLGGPVLSDMGDLFEGTVDSFSLAILDDGISVNGKRIEPGDAQPLRFVFTRIEPQNITDGLLDMARTWMLKAEIVNYQAYIDAVVGKRQEAIDRFAAEQAAKEEAERKAAEEAARQAEEQKKKQEEEEQKKKQEEEEKKNGTNGDANANGTTVRYDAYGNPISSSNSQVEYDAYGNPISTSNSSGGYDAYGNPISSSNSSSGYDAYDNTYGYGYDYTY